MSEIIELKNRRSPFMVRKDAVDAVFVETDDNNDSRCAIVVNGCPIVGLTCSYKEACEMLFGITPEYPED